MTTSLPSSLTPTAAPAAAAPTAAASAAHAVLPVSGVASAAQVAPILAAAQAALAKTVNLSPQAQQAIKAEAFAQLVSQLVQQIQGGTVQLPANWPAGGVTPQWQALLAALVQQASAGQPLPQQLLSVQSWPAALAQAVLQSGAGSAGGAPVPSAPSAATLASAAAAPQAPTGAGAAAASAASPGASGAAGQAAGAGTPAATVRPALPALQNWLVQQGVLQGPDGERAFTLTLRVPVAWAQAQSVLGQALGAQIAGGGAALPGSALGALLLPYGSSVQQLGNATFGLVLAPQGLPAAQTQAMRTSAVLQLEFQPMPMAASQVAQQAVTAGLLPAGMLPQEAYQALLARGGDPWLHMAQQQASGQLPRERQQHGSDGQCNRAGCQYQGRAECAQPFCAEMNSLWAASRSSRL
ncbi:MAG: Fe-S oxidoreductase [Comamonas sp.]|nr:Fe-S oxidoreductase [Comamonas sp.]